jgi:hypothetical protein
MADQVPTTFRLDAELGHQNQLLGRKGDDGFEVISGSRQLAQNACSGIDLISGHPLLHAISHAGGGLTDGPRQRHERLIAFEEEASVHTSRVWQPSAHQVVDLKGVPGLAHNLDPSLIGYSKGLQYLCTRKIGCVAVVDEENKTVNIVSYCLFELGIFLGLCYNRLKISDCKTMSEKHGKTILKYGPSTNIPVSTILKPLFVNNVFSSSEGFEKRFVTLLTNPVPQTILFERNMLFLQRGHCRSVHGAPKISAISWIVRMPQVQGQQTTMKTNNNAHTNTLCGHICWK